MSVEELESAALKLETRERARLAGKLLSSLEILPPAEAQRLWAEEALRRHEALEQGNAAALPADDVLREARSRL